MDDAAEAKAREKAERIAKYLDMTVNATALILTVLKEVSGAAPIPGLKVAAGSALTILNTIQDMGDNKAGFKHLMRDVAEYTFTIVQFVNTSANELKTISKELEENLERFNGDLEVIGAFVNEKLKRCWFIRMIYSQADKLKIVEYRRRLGQATNRFQIVMQMNIHETVKQLAEGELERRGGIDMLYQIPPAPLPPPAPMHVYGPYTPNTVTNTNSNNVKISNTINSNNDNSVRIGPVRGPKRGPKRQKS